MNLFKAISTTVLTSFTALSLASAALATPTEGTLDAHAALLLALKSNGVNVTLNHAECEENGTEYDGFYLPARRLLAVCQDRSYAGGPNVEWTANDLDTLRHEAQHFIQDCMTGTNHDGNLSSVYRDPIAFALDVIGIRRAESISTRYQEVGADPHTIKLELEAFGMAARNVPLEQAGDIETYCR